MLFRSHGGTIAVASVAGEGTTFTVAIPLGKAHLDFQRIAKAPALSSTVVTTAALVEEALRWLPHEPAANGHAAEPDSRTSFESEEVRLDRESDGDERRLDVGPDRLANPWLRPLPEA